MSRVRSCFISAPAGSDLSVLRALLTERGISIRAPDAVSSGTSLAGEIRRVLSEVDLVIGVLTRERRSDWILFELGQAYAEGRQILLLVPPQSSAYVPSDLKGVITLRAGLANREAIAFTLDQLVAAPERQERPKTVPVEQPSLDQKAIHYIEQTRAAISDRQGRELERILADAIRESGVDTLTTEPRGDRCVDMAVWADGLQSTVGNPLLIEVKLSAAHPGTLREAASNFSKQLGSAGVRWGLLVLGEAPDVRPIDTVLPPNVLAITADDLLQRMRSAPFAEVVNELRNRRVHGVAN
jgi:hypothetical protein